MPLKIPAELPAYNVLSEENIFVMNIERASHQDIRPLKIGILNLMPIKIQAENQLLRYLSNTPLQVDITLLQTKSYTGNHTPLEHLEKFYRYIDDVKNEKFDGLIITGAPVEKMDFEEVDYWDELKDIMEWSKTHVYSTVHICWGAQAALYHHYNIPKYQLEKKLFVVPIENKLLYVETIYQVLINENQVPILKKVIVSAGNKLAIGDDLKTAIKKLISQEAVDIEIEEEDIEYLINEIIEANKNLKESNESNDWTMIGNDIKKLQELINKLEEAKLKEEKDEEELIENI